MPPLPLEEMPKYMPLVVEVAKKIASLPGLRWKVWGFSPETREVLGLYLFDDETSLKAYLDGPIMAERKSGKWGPLTISDVSIKQVDLMEEPTKITRGSI